MTQVPLLSTIDHTQSGRFCERFLCAGCGSSPRPDEETLCESCLPHAHCRRGNRRRNRCRENRYQQLLYFLQSTCHVVECQLDEFSGRCEIHAHPARSAVSVRGTGVQKNLRFLYEETLDDDLRRNGLCALL